MGFPELAQRQSYGWEANLSFAAKAAEGERASVLPYHEPKKLGDRGGAAPMGSVLRSFEDGGSISQGFFAQMNLSGAEVLQSPYRENSYVNTCVRCVSRAMLQAPLRLYEGDPLDKDSKAKPATSPDAKQLLDLLNSPNPLQAGDEFRVANYTHRALDGETVWFLMDKMGKPLQLQDNGKIPIPATIVSVIGKAVEIRTNERGLPDGFIYPSKSRTRFPAHSVVRFLDYDPDNPLRGLGPIQALQRELSAEFAAQRYQEGLFANGGDPGGWIIGKKRPPSPEKQKAIQDEIDDDYGNANNAGRWRAIYGDVEVKANVMSPKDMDYSQLRNLNFTRTASALGVPLTLIGGDLDAKYANYEAAQRALWEGPIGIVSYHRSEESVLNNVLLPRLSIKGGERLVFRYDHSRVSVLQEDVTEKVNIASQIVARGTGTTLNEVKQDLGIATTPGNSGDLRLFHQSLRDESQLIQATPEPAAPAKPSKSEEPVKATAAPETKSTDFARIERLAWAKLYVAKAEAHYEEHFAEMNRAMKTFLRKYELAQVARIEAFAATGQADLEPGATKDFSAGQITEQDIINLLLDPQEWGGKLADVAAAPITDTFAAAANGVAQELNAAALALEDPQVLALLQSQISKLSTGVAGSYDSTLAKKVKRAFADVFEEAGGTNVTSLQDAIRKLLPELKGTLKQAFADRDARALAIARTETGKASNGARFLSMQRSPVVQEHEWVDSDDSDVRPSHASLDGQRVKLGDEFKPGLKYPLDPDAPASESVNCRCTTLPVLIEPADAA